jgi:hypothetical protein
MTLSMYQASAPVFQHALTALSGILDKAMANAAARKIDPTVFLVARLAPDMFAFTKQVQIACDFAKNTVARLAGQEPPKFPDEEKTFDELKARIAKTIDFVSGFKPAQIDGTEANDITFPAGPGKTMTLKGQAYLLNFALPNFYFHATAAYAILRHNGVDLGKLDFLGHVQG